MVETNWCSVQIEISVSHQLLHHSMIISSLYLHIHVLAFIDDVSLQFSRKQLHIFEFLVCNLTVDD